MSINQNFKNVVEESIQIHEKLLENDDFIKSVEALAETLIETLSLRNRIFFAGNGGSFSDSIHLAAEFVCRFQMNRAPLPAMALGTNGATFSAASNDFNFDHVYKRELEAFAKADDTLIVLSTSGNSSNIVALVEKALELKMSVYALTGESGGALKALCPCLQVPGKVTARVQEIHILTGHYLCEVVEKGLFET